MLTPEKIRSLDPSFENLTDEQIEELIKPFFTLAELALDAYRAEKMVPKIPPR